jgi:hypothetical protein
VMPTSWTSPEEDETRVAAVRRLWSALGDLLPSSFYVNNMTEDDQGRVKAAFGENYDRLVELKTRWDPTNFFRLNANIASRVSPG